jgi:tRNA A-37 threonylcarbamoyl transferase component Bud32
MLSTSKLVIHPDWRDWLRAQGLATFSALADCAAGTVVKTARSTEVRRLPLAGRTVFIKKYWANNFRQLWSGALRGAFFGKTKARREYDNLLQLRAWGFDAPAPVAYGEERRAGWVVRSCLVSEAIPEALSLDEFFVRCQARRSTEEPTLLPALADYVRRLHARGFVHHDLYWRNIILSGNSRDHFFLLDAHKGGPGDPAQDLAALDAAAPFFFRRADRLRFFLRYRHHNKLTPDDKSLLRRILALAEPLRERQLQRIRRAHR